MQRIVEVVYVLIHLFYSPNQITAFQIRILQIYIYIDIAQKGYFEIEVSYKFDHSPIRKLN